MVKDEAFFKAIRDFLDVYLIKRKGCSYDTQRAYRISLNLLMQYFTEKQGLKLSEIGFDHMTFTNICGFMDWLTDERQCSAHTAGLRLMAIRSFAKFVTIQNPAKIHFQIELRNVPKPKAQTKIVEFLSENALQKLLSQPDITKQNGRRDIFFMTLMYDTAARCQELLDIRLCDINIRGNKCEIYVTGKGSKSRFLSLSEKATKHLKSYLNEFHNGKTSASTDFLFFTKIHGTTNQLSSDAVRAFMKRYGESARVSCAEVPSRVHPHQLRHTRAMHLYRSGVPIMLVSEFLGHSKVDTTKIYAWADTEMKRDAIDKVLPESQSAEIPIWQNNDIMIKKLYGLA